MINVSTAGLGAQITSTADAGAKRLLGNLAYLISGISHARNLQAQDVALEGPDFSWHGPAFGVVR